MRAMSAIGTKRTCELHPLVNENVPAVFNLIERAHALDKRSGCHPNPACNGRVYI